jgi:hypothetical protein
LTPQPLHTEEGSGLLLDQFRDSEVLQGMLGAALKQLDMLEIEILRARDVMCLESAPRFMLELIAKIVGQDCGAPRDRIHDPHQGRSAA